MVRANWGSAVGAGAEQMKEGTVEMSGTVVGVNRHPVTVELANGPIVRGFLAGRLMKNEIRVLVGDRVVVEMSPYDLTQAGLFIALDNGRPSC
jgi:translation initiation factor IF-1